MLPYVRGTFNLEYLSHLTGLILGKFSTFYILLHDHSPVLDAPQVHVWNRF